MNEKLGQAEMFVLVFCRFLFLLLCRAIVNSPRSQLKVVENCGFCKKNLFLHSRFFIRKSYFSDNDTQNDIQNDTQNVVEIVVENVIENIIETHRSRQRWSLGSS